MGSKRTSYPLGWGLLDVIWGCYISRSSEEFDRIQTLRVGLFVLRQVSCSTLTQTSFETVIPPECCFSRLLVRPRNLHFNKLSGVVIKFMETIAPKPISRSHNGILVNEDNSIKQHKVIL